MSNMKKYLDLPGLTFFYNQIKKRFALKVDVGAPKMAKTKSEMTDQSKIYVYTGSESGYTYGNWYHYDSGEWQSGGAYNSLAVSTDPNLEEEGVPADAQATGEALDELKEEMQEYTATYYNPITSEDVVNMWVEE